SIHSTVRLLPTVIGILVESALPNGILFVAPGRCRYPDHARLQPALRHSKPTLERFGVTPHVDVHDLRPPGVLPDLALRKPDVGIRMKWSARWRTVLDSLACQPIGQNLGCEQHEHRGHCD